MHKLEYFHYVKQKTIASMIVYKSQQLMDKD